jgi:hypothetical protein
MEIINKLPSPNCCKIVSRLDNGRLVSYLTKAKEIRGKFGMTSGTTSLRVHYQFGKWSYPKIGRLFVFGTNEQALIYAGHDRSVQVWEAFGTDLEKAKGISNVDYLDLDRVISFWEAYYDEASILYSRFYVNAALSGTMTATSVMLIKRIQ